MATVLITNCRSGLGFELAKQLLNHESRKPEIVIATYRPVQPSRNLMALAEEHKNLYLLELDMHEMIEFDEIKEEVENIVGERGLNMLVHNAGVYLADLPDIESVTEEDLNLHFIINTIAPVMLTKALLPLLRKAVVSNSSKPLGPEKAAVYYMTSDLGSIEGNTDGEFWAYRESKAAAHMSFRSLYHEFRNEEIAVLIVYPGWIRSRLGGLEAPTSPAECVTTLLPVMFSLSETNNGQFLDSDGSELIW